MKNQRKKILFKNNQLAILLISETRIFLNHLCNSFNQKVSRTNGIIRSKKYKKQQQDRIIVNDISFEQKALQK
jgi:hypothetical protein